MVCSNHRLPYTRHKLPTCTGVSLLATTYHFLKRRIPSRMLNCCQRLAMLILPSGNRSWLPIFTKVRSCRISPLLKQNIYNGLRNGQFRYNIIIIIIIIIIITKVTASLWLYIYLRFKSRILFQPVLHDWFNKSCGMCYPGCEMVHIKPLLLIRKSSPCSGSGFPLHLSEWSFAMSDTI